MQEYDSQQYEHPSKRSAKRLAWTVAGIGSMFSVLLLLLLYAIGKDDAVVIQRTQSEEVIDLLQTPRGRGTEVVDINSSDVGIELPQGGWVQQTDSMGNLVQQYRCESLDPDPPLLPPGWIEMEKPEVELILSDNRLIRIQGDTGVANAPKRTLESGEIAGHVIVSLFEVKSGSFDTLDLEPVMVLETPQISFDNFIGEITCKSDVRITSPTQTLVGSNLIVRFNDLEERVEYLRLEELDYIEFTQASTPSPPKPVPPSISDYKTPPIRKTQKVKATAIGSSIEYYLMTLSTNVVIVQGNPSTGRFAKGNKLTLSFSNKSDNPKSAKDTRNMNNSFVLNGTLASAIVATALAVPQEQGSDLVRITCEDGLTMIPLEDASLMPSTPQDTRIELFKFEDAPVQIIDNVQGMIATGDLFRFEVLGDRGDLFGSPASLLNDDTLTTSPHLWIARQDGAGGAIGEGSIVHAPSTTQDTTLNWSDRVDFTFEPTDNNVQGDLSEIIFYGDVVLTNQGSDVTCSSLKVIFEQDESGSSTPSLAIAYGDVKATSDSQILWADEAHVTFTQEDVAAKTTEDSMFGSSSANRMQAFGDVQVLLNDGGRAFCDELDGHISQDLAILKGNVVIAYKRMLMNRGENAVLTLDQSTGQGTWQGAGQALFLDDPLDVSPDRRIDRPTMQIPNSQQSSSRKVSMRTNWHRSMRIDQHFNNDAGAIDFSGDVDVRSRQSEIELSQMTGDDLRLEFELLKVDSEADERELRRVIAKNNAQIEHRLWTESDPDEPPVVYYIGGNHIEFDVITKEALAVGQGELVLRDPREPNMEMHQSAIAGRGTTRFTWDKKLKTTRLTKNLYRIKMSGNVEMIHKGLDGSIGMLTSDTIEAIAIDPQPTSATHAGVSEISLRGMDLQQLKADGSVYVATGTRRVDCDHFDYNLRTGFAELTSDGDRSVAIVTQGTQYPVRAKSIVWNMDPAVDTITIHGLQGSSSN